MDKKQEYTTFEKVLGNIIYYAKPDIVKDKYRSKIKDDASDKKLLKKYYRSLMDIKWIFDKVKKYELYFEKFYPNCEEIKDYEALEHHIHAYLQDLTILRNKVLALVGKLRNDIKGIASNKKEIVGLFDELKEQINNVFAKVLEVRDPHHHNGMRHFDGDIIDAAAPDFFEKDSLLKSSIKKDSLKNLKVKGKEAFIKARNNYVKLARENNIQISGFLDSLFDNLKYYIYHLLKIKPILN